MADGSEQFERRNLENLLEHAEAALASIDEPMPFVQPFRLPDFAVEASPKITAFEPTGESLDLEIELGRTTMYREDALKLCKGAVVPLEPLSADPVDIVVNGRKIGRGEVLVLNDKFCVRVTELSAQLGTA